MTRRLASGPLVLAAIVASIACADPKLTYLGSDVTPGAPPTAGIQPSMPVAVDLPTGSVSAPVVLAPSIDAQAPTPVPDTGPPDPDPLPDEVMMFPSMDAGVPPFEAPIDAGEPRELAESSTPTPPCPIGFEDCDGNADNGCETDTSSDEAHCGGCEQACTAAAASAASAECVEGSCVLACRIPGLLGDCDGDPDNGCETELFHNVNNCGMCGRRCTLCIDGLCL